jgi:hypothetical protein
MAVPPAAADAPPCWLVLVLPGLGWWEAELPPEPLLLAPGRHMLKVLLPLLLPPAMLAAMLLTRWPAFLMRLNMVLAML